MSWSILFIGKPENIIKALEEKSTKLDGNSKEEFDKALPNMIGLVKLNYNKSYEPVLKLSAAGHSYENYSTCTFNIEAIPASIV